jgi:hypothetical protein
MFDMNQQVLPLPNPQDWATKAGAATLLDVNLRTIDRMIEDGRLTAHAPIGARNAERLLWVPEVVELVNARRRAAPTDAEPARAQGPYCLTCGDPVIADGSLHVWRGRAGLPDRPYAHKPQPAIRG